MTPSSDPSRQQRRDAVKRHVDGSILVKVRIYLAIFLVVLIAGVVEAARGTGWSWAYLGGGIAVGTVVGVFAARMQRFDWDSFEERVVAKFDVVGIVVLVVYILFAVFRDQVVGAWVPVAYASDASLGVVAGAMGGQVLGVQHGLLNLRRRALSQRREAR